MLLLQLSDQKKVILDQSSHDSAQCMIDQAVLKRGLLCKEKKGSQHRSSNNCFRHLINLLHSQILSPRSCDVGRTFHEPDDNSIVAAEWNDPFHQLSHGRIWERRKLQSS